MTLVDDLLAIAAIPAPTFSESARADWIERRLDGLPGVVSRDEVGNLIWRWGKGRPKVLLAAHMDTVFPADTPLEFKRDGDFLVGPGIGDNAAAIAVTIDVVAELLAAGDLGAGAVAFTVGEEGAGNLRGAAHAVRTLDPEIFIAVEGHMLEAAMVDAVGSVRARITVTAPGGHSWSDRGSASAIHELFRIAQSLLPLAGPDSPVNVGTVSGGRSVNTIADSAEMVVECRSVHQADLDRFERALGELAVAPGCSVEVEPIGRRPGGRLDRDSQLLAALTEVRAELGLSVDLAAASTDANAAHAQGVPALCVGVSRGSGMHSLNERIDAGTLAIGADQLRKLLQRLLDDTVSTTARNDEQGEREV